MRSQGSALRLSKLAQRKTQVFNIAPPPKALDIALDKPTASSIEVILTVDFPFDPGFFTGNPVPCRYVGGNLPIHCIAFG